MKIVIMVEGKTAEAFLPHLREFLKTRLANRMPKLDPDPYHGRIPKGDQLKRDVERHLNRGKTPADAVVALTDVYTGTNPPDFADAADAKAKMRKWDRPKVVDFALGRLDTSGCPVPTTEIHQLCGMSEISAPKSRRPECQVAKRRFGTIPRKWVRPNPKFYPHAAQYEFEAWLIPFGSDIEKLAGHKKAAPKASPEQINHNSPPSQRIRELFLAGKPRKYAKPRDAHRILRGKDLLVAAQACPELKAFLNTILTLCQADPIA